MINTAADGINFGYDNAFRITGITDTGASANSWTLGYDLLDRVTSAAKTGTTYGWTYDADGNRLTQTGTSASTFTPSSSSNRLSSATGALARTYSYDTAGNTKTYSNLTFSYNNRGRVSSVTVGSTTSNYVYSALGQMIKKTVGSTTTLLMYDEAGHLLGEYSSSGALIQETVWLGDIPVATLRPNGSTGCTSTICVFYVHTDQLNAPRKVTRPSDNKLAWRWDTDPFGAAAPNQNPASLGTFIYNLRFPGQYNQAETGLSQNYFRDYDPKTPRYLESDPIGLRGEVNTYTYVGNEPLGNTDPLGLCKIDVRFKPVPGIVGRLGEYHAYIVTTDPNGSQTYFRGGPDEQPNWMSYYGYLTTEHGPYVSNTRDWSTDKRPSVRVLDNDAPCSCYNNKFASILDKIKAAKFFYGPLWKNSNSVAGTALRDSGFNVGQLPVSAPLFNQELNY
jgi:RHS repeat-associated protein